MWSTFRVTKQTPELRHWSRPNVFIVNFKFILHFVLVFSLFNLNKQMFAARQNREEYWYEMV